MVMTVQEALSKYKTKVIWHKKDEEAAQAMLKPGEEVLWATDAVAALGLGYPEPKRYRDYTFPEGGIVGTVVVSDRRVFFCANGAIKAERQIALQDIQKVAYSSQRDYGCLQICSLMDTISVYELEKRLLSGKAILEELLERRNRLQPAPNAAAPGAEELRQWKALLDDGIITQAEFEAKKRQLLGL